MQWFINAYFIHNRAEKMYQMYLDLSRKSWDRCKKRMSGTGHVSVTWSGLKRASQRGRVSHAYKDRQRFPNLQKTVYKMWINFRIKTLNIFLSTVHTVTIAHNLAKDFRDLGQSFHDLWALRWQCIKDVIPEAWINSPCHPLMQVSSMQRSHVIQRHQVLTWAEAKWNWRDTCYLHLVIRTQNAYWWYGGQNYLLN